MENLLYSLNATLPVFLVIVLGYVLRRMGMLDEPFISAANTLTYNVTLPVYLFCDMAGADLRQEFQPKLVLFSIISTTVIVFGLWAVCRLVMKDRAMIGAFVQASFRSGLAILGAAFITNIYGDAHLLPQILLGGVPCYNIYSVLLLTVENPDRRSGKGQLGKTVKDLFTNPLMLAILAGVAVSALRIPMPTILQKSMNTVGSMASPLALICIGAGFEGRKALGKLKPTMAISLIKLIVLPGIFLPMAAAMGFRDQALATLLIMLGAPTTSTSYVVAKSMGADHVLTSSAVVVTTLLSSFTITFWIFLFRFLGYL